MKLALLFAMSLGSALAQTSPRATPGAPFSADQYQERISVQDGKTVTSGSIIAHFYRDSQGRTRTERAPLSGTYWQVVITDPVAGIAWRVDERNKVAVRRPAPAAPSPSASPRISIEDLGTQTFDSLTARGTRTTHLLPGGTPWVTTEAWDAIDLNVSLLTRSSNGYSFRLINLRREEPAPALFQPPAGYTITDMPQ